MTDDVAAVVVAYHRPEDLRRLLGGLRGMPTVVVNVEADAAISGVIASHGGAVEVAAVENDGFAAAVNRGVAASSGAWIAVLNDDIVARAADLRELAAVGEGAGASVAVPMIVDRAGRFEPTIAALPSVRSLTLEWLLLPDRPVPVIDRFLHPQKWRQPTRVEPIDAAAATCVVAHADVLRRHRLPESYFLYWEEMEWFTTLRRAGERSVYVPDVVVVHEGGRADVRPAKSVLLARNAVRCVRRTGGRRAAAAALPVVILWQARLLLGDLFRRRRDRIPARRAGVTAAFGAWREVW